MSGALVPEWGPPSGGRGRVRRRNLKDDIAAHIRELVFAAELRPGMRVDQDAVAAELGVSKLPVREALIVLEAEGLIAMYPSRGAFIADLTPEDFHDTYLAVGQISALAARRAASRITDAEVAELRELMARMQSDAGVLDGDSHHEFHRLVNVLGGSRRLNRVLRSLANALPERLHVESRGGTPGVAAEHIEMFAALVSRDGERAAAATLAHFVGGAGHAVDLLAERGFWDDVPPLRR
jgi:DNA-binding GntR family transcriptional regulator